MFIELGLFVCAIFLYLFWRDNFCQGCAPPGPLKLPIIGNIHQIAGTGRTLPFEAFDILSKKYGPIMSVKLGMKEAVVISSYEDMAELLTKDECSGRVMEPFLAERNFGKEQGIVFGNGEEWKQVRRFTIRNLREFGFGKKHSMESAMEEELDELIQETKLEMEKNNGKVHVRLFFSLTVLNVMWSMVAGKRFSRGDPKLNVLMDLNERAFKLANFGSDVLIAFPFMGHLFPGLTGAQVFTQLFKELQQYFREMFEEYRDRETRSENPDCFVDVYINKMEEEAKAVKDPAQRFFTEEQFITVMMDLFQTGTETLNGSLSYALLFMIRNPEIQKKVQEEIDRIGDVKFSLKSQFVYTEATLLEVLRMGDIVPIIPPRKVMSDFKYKGYEFKKGMTLIPNLYSTFSSKTYWGDPEVFRPERFIGTDGKLSDKFAPFGFGKRFCMGETLASSTLFLYFTTMLKQFTFKKLPNQPEPTEVPLPAFTLTPQPFDMLVEIRQ